MRRAVLCGVVWLVGGGVVWGAENLVGNGGFDGPGEALRGWVTDYAWSGNAWYRENIGRVTVVEREGARRHVARLESEADEGTKMECAPISFDPEGRYRCTLEVKGGPYRIYFAGYRWKPRIGPRDDPSPGDLRLVYKGKAAEGTARGWTTVKIEMPGTQASPQARRHLGQVRFITVYVWVMRTGYIDNVRVTRVDG